MGQGHPVPGTKVNRMLFGFYLVFGQSWVHFFWIDVVASHMWSIKMHGYFRWFGEVCNIRIDFIVSWNKPLEVITCMYIPTLTRTALHSKHTLHISTCISHSHAHSAHVCTQSISTETIGVCHNVGRGTDFPCCIIWQRMKSTLKCSFHIM